MGGARGRARPSTAVARETATDHPPRARLLALILALSLVPGSPAGPVDARSVAGTGGTLAPDGRLRATAPGELTVTAAVAGLRASGRITVAPDTIAPVATTPALRPRKGATVDTGLVPMLITWSATDTGTGVASYELRRRLDGGAFEPVALASPTATSLAVRLPVGRAVQYQVRATDRAGNIGAWTGSGAFHLRLATERASTVRYAGRWTTRTSAGYLGGALRYSKRAGATTSFSFTGHGVAWISSRGPTRGSARVSVDGRVVATINLNAAASTYRRVAWSMTWSKAGTHRVTIRVLGTARHPRVDVDGFAVLDSASPYPVLVGAGDIASCASTADSATTSLIERIPGTVFAAGDIAYERGTAAELANC